MNMNTDSHGKQLDIALQPIHKNPLIRYKFALYYRRFARYNNQLEVDCLDIMGLGLPKHICCQLVSTHIPEGLDTVHDLYDKIESSVLKAFVDSKTPAEFHAAVKKAVLKRIDRKLPGLKRRVELTSALNPLQHCLDEIARTFGLDEAEMDILLMSYLKRCLYWIWDTEPNQKSTRIKQMAYILSIPAHQCSRYLQKKAPLQKSGCLDEDLTLNEDIGAYLDCLIAEPLSSRYYSKCIEPALSWAMHGQLTRQHGDTLKSLILNRVPGKPLNILLHGEPGTGKTAFALSLAAELGLDLYQIKQEATDHREEKKIESHEFRCQAIRMCNDRINQSNSLMLVDEAENLFDKRSYFALLFGDDSEDGDKKGRMNCLLEELKLPCIWIINTKSESLIHSTRRRFDYSIQFQKLNRDQRVSIWQNCLERYQLHEVVNKELVSRLASQYKVSAGGIDIALRNSARIWKDQPPTMNQAGQTLEKLLKPHCQLMGIRMHNELDRLAENYDLSGLNIRGSLPLDLLVTAAGTFLKQLEADQVQPDTPRMNVLLYGPPGTGKSEWVKYLGEKLGREVFVQVGSHLLSKYIGETERRIAEAFEKAERDQSILFLDEVDGMLYSRAMAQRSWEVTQVNELLYRMEHFRGVLVCATNAMDNLDPASIRRFTFKLQFDYLNHEGKRIFYKRFLESMATDPFSPRHTRKLADLTHLAPGDFRNVRQALYYQNGKDIQHDHLLELLEQETVAKRQGQTSGLIGFHPQ